MAKFKKQHPLDVRPAGPTPEMLRAAAAAYLDRQRCNLWSRTFALLDEDREAAEEFVAEVVDEVLAELPTT